MQVTHPDQLGDLGDLILATEFGLGICWPVDDYFGRLARKAAVIDLPESEYVSPADRMEEIGLTRRGRSNEG